MLAFVLGQENVLKLNAMCKKGQILTSAVFYMVGEKRYFTV